MTMLRDETELEPVEVTDEPIPDVDVDLDETAEASRWRWQRVVAIIVVAVLVVVLTFAFFTGPVERAWYRNRQSQLAADMTATHPRIEPGQAVAVLQIPKYDVNVVVIEGDGPQRLRSGPGHRVGTPFPGARGNSVVMGHHRAWGAPFGALSKVKRGDWIVVQSRAQKTVAYSVRSIKEVGGGDTALLRSSKDYRLTLVTGRGGRTSSDRLVVTAISGKRATGSSSGRFVRAETPGPSLPFNLTLLAALVLIGLAAGAWIYLRHRSRMAARIVVVLPMAAAAILAALLYVDLFLPPLD